jgi:hypothetical protein
MACWCSEAYSQHDSMLFLCNCICSSPDCLQMELWSNNWCSKPLTFQSFIREFGLFCQGVNIIEFQSNIFCIGDYTLPGKFCVPLNTSVFHVNCTTSLVKHVSESSQLCKFQSLSFQLVSPLKRIKWF